MKNEQIYLNTLQLSADCPEELRACDLDRVVNAAENQFGKSDGFIDWLLTQPLMKRTKNRLKAMIEAPL